MKNITLNNVKDTAFLANESYKNAVENDENINKEKEMYKGKPLTNPATNSSFEVFNQKNEITNINVIGEVELGFSNI